MVFILSPREPFSTWSHAIWFLLVLPGCWLLWKRSTGDTPKRVSAMVYGSSLMLCSFSSALYHGTPHQSEALALLDYTGIYFLIAGTNTVIVWNLLEGKWRRNILLAVWCAAIGGSFLHVFVNLPHWLSSGTYLLMGWGSVFACTEVARQVPWRPMAPVLNGGVLYSVGAALNLLHWPTLFPGVFGPHDLFHLFVVAASAIHFRFVLTVALKHTEVVHEQRRVLQTSQRDC